MAGKDFFKDSDFDKHESKSNKGKYIVAFVAVCILACLFASMCDSTKRTEEDSKDVAPSGATVTKRQKNVVVESKETATPEAVEETVVPVTQIQPATNAVADKVEQIPEKVKTDSQEPENAVDGLTPEKVEQKALEVIRGDFGNNPKRRRKLGSDYEVIQKKVNEMYRKGLVY